MCLCSECSYSSRNQATALVNMEIYCISKLEHLHPQVSGFLNWPKIVANSGSLSFLKFLRFSQKPQSEASWCCSVTTSARGHQL